MCSPIEDKRKDSLRHVRLVVISEQVEMTTARECQRPFGFFVRSRLGCLTGAFG